MAELRTVKIKDGKDDFSVINQEDFDPLTMEMYFRPSKVQPVKKAVPPPTRQPEPVEETPPADSQKAEEDAQDGQEDEAFNLASLDPMEISRYNLPDLELWAARCTEIAWVGAVLDIETRKVTPRKGALKLLAGRLAELG